MKSSIQLFTVRYFGKNEYFSTRCSIIRLLSGNLRLIRILSLVIIFMFAINLIKAQDVTTVEAASAEISDNLDLEVIASLFGEAKDLEDFEQKLNDPDLQISNLDLNGDGWIDYLRVVEASDNQTHVVIIQSVLGNDMFQDVATIDVEKDPAGETRVQVVGNVYMYGPDFIITPVYIAPPVIFVWFWGPVYRPWCSPYHWGYYPPRYHPWAPVPPNIYRNNVQGHVNSMNHYNYTSDRYSHNAPAVQSLSARSDFARNHPEKSFQKRNNGVKNRSGLSNNNRSTSPVSPKSDNSSKTQAKPVQNDWQSKSERNNEQNQSDKNKVSGTSNTDQSPSRTSTPASTLSQSEDKSTTQRSVNKASSTDDATQAKSSRTRTRTSTTSKSDASNAAGSSGSGQSSAKKTKTRSVNKR